MYSKNLFIFKLLTLANHFLKLLKICFFLYNVLFHVVKALKMHHCLNSGLLLFLGFFLSHWPTFSVDSGSFFILIEGRFLEHNKNTYSFFQFFNGFYPKMLSKDFHLSSHATENNSEAMIPFPLPLSLFFFFNPQGVLILVWGKSLSLHGFVCWLVGFFWEAFLCQLILFLKGLGFCQTIHLFLLKQWQYEPEQVHACAENAGGLLASNKCKEPPVITQSDFIPMLKCEMKDAS